MFIGINLNGKNLNLSIKNITLAVSKSVYCEKQLIDNNNQVVCCLWLQTLVIMVNLKFFRIEGFVQLKFEYFKICTYRFSEIIEAIWIFFFSFFVYRFWFAAGVIILICIGTYFFSLISKQLKYKFVDKCQFPACANYGNYFG